jgi:hypothetical protein
MRPLLVVVLLAGFTPAHAAPVPKAVKKKDDKELIVGTWKPANKGTCWFQFNADGTMKTWHDPNAHSPLDWTWAIEETDRLPKRIKLARAVGSGAYDCIYELDGDGLKIAFIVGTKDPQKLEAGRGVELYEQTRDTSGK